MLEVTLTLVALLAVLIYVFMSWNFGYWRKRNVPGPPPRLLIGNFPHLYTMKRHVAYDIDDIYQGYKDKYDAVGIYGARYPMLLVISPELARRVFVSDFKHFHDNEISLMVDEKSDFLFANNPFCLVGEEWKQRRADVTPGLTMGRIKTVYPVTNEVSSLMSDWLRKQLRLAAPQGIDAKDMCLRFTSEMVTDCVLGLKAESFSDKPTPILANIKNLFAQSYTLMLYFVVVSTYHALLRFFKLRFVPVPIERFFVDLMQNAVDSRRAQLAAGKQFERIDFLDYILKLANKNDLDTRQLTARTMTFLLDGFETTATVLSHLFLLLGRHEQVQQRLLNELQAHLNEKGVIDFDKLNELPFLDACVQESVRLFPPAFMSNKLCTEPIELTNKKGENFVLERGITVIVPHFSLMQDEEFFPNPKDFQPDRFMQPNAAKMYREQGAFLPFGDGPRVCIGMRFALTQIKAAVVEVLTNFKVRVNPKTRTDDEYEPTGIITGLKGGIWLDFEERK